MGSSYIGGADYYHELCENLENVDKSYERHGNHYGTGHNHSTYVYEIFCKDQYKAAKDFYNKIAYGGIVKQNMPKINGQIAKMKDGTIITYREITSSQGSSAVEINIKGSNNPCGLKNQKIHFVKR